MKTKLILFYTILFCTNLSAQREADNWLFGRNCALRFENNLPVANTNGALNTEEGCAVISDKNGNLLFYTDGIKVWNKNHQVMPNGSDLKGDPSSTQSGVAIPRPGATNQYYLFSVPATASAPGICYSLVDMTLDSGKGDVVSSEKNQLLAETCTEKLTAVLHRNGKDFWVIAHGWKSNAFFAWLVTANGVVREPVVSKIGVVHEGGVLNTQGYMKVNPDGTNIALALEEQDLIELFDFDNSSGEVSKPISLKMPEKSYVYGIEFSPNGSVLYASAAGTGQIVQFNLQLATTEQIQASKTIVGKSPNGEWVGALQLASNGIIYYPIYGTTFMGSILHPNKVGLDCSVKNNTVDLLGKMTSLGLPTFTQSFFERTETKTFSYFDATKVKKGDKMVLKNIQFDFAKSTLKPISNFELDKVVAYMKNNPNQRILLSGHTDNIGNKSSNLALSDARANAVMSYLVSKGIQQNRIETKGSGSSDPIVPNTTEANRATNRRVEIIFL